MVPYFDLIEKYIPSGSTAHRVYVIHVTLVTQLALKIGWDKGLTTEQLQFIEEAGMLHDIGITKTNTPKLGCHGDLPYMNHLTEGRSILQAEGLPRHARVAANHVGVGGLSKEEIVSQKLPLPAEDILCESIEERIISYADLWYSKNPNKLWNKMSLDRLRSKLAVRPQSLERFNTWYLEFGE